MNIKVNNIKGLDEAINNKLMQISKPVLNNFNEHASNKMTTITAPFRGKASRSIADWDSTQWCKPEISPKRMKLDIVPVGDIAKVFLRNAAKTGGFVLQRTEAPEWFGYIESETGKDLGDSVNVRSTGDTVPGLKPSLGTKERQFFSITREYLRKHAQSIIDMTRM